MIAKYKKILLFLISLTVLPVVFINARPEVPASVPVQIEDDFMSGDDSLVRLISASKARLLTIGGVSFRKIEGPALFLHNNTYLKCDEALWNVDSNFIDATGHVEIIQKETRLKSERMHYYARQNLVQFRGPVVELIDKDTNILRTRFLDYHTKDSVATFFGGGSMKDNDGKIIESIEGSYDSKTKVFNFSKQVGMYADGMVVKTNSLDYNADTDIAYFRSKTFIWNDDNFLAANKGSYDSNTAIIEFDDDCCILTPTQEVQSDKLFYYRKTSEADLYNNVQIEDIEQSIMMFGDYAYYAEDPFKAYLTKKPAFALYGQDDDGRPDTLFMSADTLLIYKKRYREIDSMEIVRAEQRLKLIDIDPIADKEEEARKKAMSVQEGSTQGQQAGKPAQGGQKGPGSQARQNAQQSRGGQSVQGGGQGNAASRGGQNARNGAGSRQVQRGGVQNGRSPMMPSPDGYSDSGYDNGYTIAYDREYSGGYSASSHSAEVRSCATGVSRDTTVQKPDSAQIAAKRQEVMENMKKNRAGQLGGQRMGPDSSGVGRSPADSTLQHRARRDSVLQTDTTAMKSLPRSSGSDSLSVTDSTAPVRDSIDLVRDTMHVTILRAHNHVKFFRRNMQGCADSLIYTTLDSITRLYKKPILWNGPKYQFTADSMQIVIEHESLKKANLINSAFVISHEDSVFFNQIKSTEMTAFFEKNEMTKFDALGGINAIFYLKENAAVSMMNKKEAKMMSVRFKDKDINRLKYYEDIKNDLISVVGLDTTQQKLRDFQWRIEERPYKRSVVTDRAVSKSRRVLYAKKTMPDFSVTNMYFEDYMRPIMKEIKDGIAARKAARLAEKMKKNESTAEEEKQEIKKDIAERSVEKREKFVSSIVTEEKISYFTLYIKDQPKARLNNMELNRMKANVTYLFKEIKSLDKLKKKEMKRISKSRILAEPKNRKKTEK